MSKDTKNCLKLSKMSNIVKNCQKILKNVEKCQYPIFNGVEKSKNLIEKIKIGLSSDEK